MGYSFRVLFRDVANLKTLDEIPLNYKGDVLCMKESTLDILCDPKTKGRLRIFEGTLKEGVLMLEQSERTYPIKGGIPWFLEEKDIIGANLKYQKLYDRIAPLYNFSNKVYFHFKFGGEAKYRNQFLEELEIKRGDRVVEISCGTGDNFPFLPEGIQLFGLDISKRMLKSCKRNLKKWGLDAELFYGNAEELPFKDETFNVVYHVGGINFFNDKEKAIREMTRIAKPGSKIIIVDETDKLIETTYKKIPIVSDYFKETTTSAPVDLIPSGMMEIKLRNICKDLMYCLSFRKPL